MEPKPIVELHTQILGILLMNSYEIKICLEATFIWSLSPLNWI